MCFLKPLQKKLFIGATMVAGVLISSVSAYDGSDAFLHYYAAPEGLKASYQSVCKSLVLSDANSDTLKNAQNEFDLAIPRILGGAALPVADGDGAIVLAEQGSAPVASAGIDYSGVNDEGFIIKSIGGKTYITGKNQVAVLRGAYHFLRLMQTSKSISSLDITENPYFQFRVLDHWYNHYNSSYEADRLYGGHRVFKMESFGSLANQGAERTRVINYCRMAASLGLNGITPDCVNTYQSGSNGNHKCLEEANLKTQKIFADILGTYGLKYYLSVSYASPRIVSPKISSADAYKNEQVRQWWNDKVDMIHSYIGNFGGFLLKADSEGEEGPRSTYKETQSQGANPIAAALKRYGYVMVWRTFIYDTSDPDFAVNQSKEFADPPQTWDDAVIIRMKDGPRDFQMIEPPHQLLSMPGARLGMEFQITQEYTGQDKHLCWLVPKWKQVYNWDIKGHTPWNGAAGTATHQILKGAGTKTGGVWAISNLSDATNWTGHYLAQANYYGWGRLAWNPALSAEQIANEWIECSFDNGHEIGVQEVLKYLLLTSWEAYTDYTIDHAALMPALGNNDHYNVDFNNMRNINFYTDWFMDFAKNCSGIGVNRCNQTGGTVRNDFAHKYHTAEMAADYCDPDKCPEELILFFHHLPWEYQMKGGMSLIQQLQFEHFSGVHQVENYIKYWDLLKADAGLDAAIHQHVAAKFKTQLTDATKWANTFRSQFGACYSTEVPCDLTIVTPDTKAATKAELATGVNLSAQLKTQKGSAAADATFNWSIVEKGVNATLSTATGASTVFTAGDPGVYTVRVAEARWPNQYADEMIFVGNWVNAPPVGTITKVVKRSLPPLKIIRGARNFVISTPIAGKISVVSLQGRVVRTITAEKAGTFIMKANGISKGLYLLQVQNESRTMRAKLCNY